MLNSNILESQFLPIEEIKQNETQKQQQQINHCHGDNQASQTDNKQKTQHKSQFQQLIQQSLLASYLMRSKQIKQINNQNNQQQEADLEEIEFEFNGITQHLSMIHETDNEKEKDEKQEENLILQSKIFQNDLANKHQNIPKSKILGQNQLSETKINKEGYLLKKSKKLFANYKVRYCFLKNWIFTFYSDQNTKRPKGILNFSQFSCNLQCIKNKSDQIESFTIRSLKYEFEFKSNEKQELNSWYQALSQAIELGKQNMENGYMFYSFPRFWKHTMISNDQFLEMAEIGDIILFRTKAMNAKLQRLFTQSEYDHVAIVLRYSKNKTYVIEATSTYGVGAFEWSTFVENNWNELYDKVVYRKLIYNKSAQEIEQLDQFVKDNLGKQYKINMNKLLKSQSIIMAPQQKIEENKERSYFCSELVAAAYKNIGLIEQIKSCTQYWPGTFSYEKKEISLLKGAQLSEEYLIGFNL